MKVGISLNIDVSKLDKSRFVQGKNGAVYCDLTGFVDLDNPDQYGNSGFITQSKKKDEDKDARLPIIGNSKVFWKDQSQQAQQQAVAQSNDILDDGDSIPF